LPSRKYGQSELNYSEGPIALNPDRQSLFIVGHSHQQAIAEFAIPELVDSTVLTDLNMAGDPIQPFATILNRASGGNPQGNNRIGGMLTVYGPEGPEPLVNAYEYGIFHTPFAGSSQKLGGGAFDAATGRICLTAQKADRQQGRYANPPVVMAYKALVPPHTKPIR